MTVVKETKHLFFSRDAVGRTYEDGSFEVEFPSGLKITMPSSPPDRSAFDVAALQMADAFENGVTGDSVRKVLCDASEMLDRGCDDRNAIKDMVRRIGKVLSSVR